MQFLSSETHSGLKKEGVSIALAPRIVPLIRGFHYRAGAKPIIEPKSPAVFLRIAEPARSTTEMVPAQDHFEVPDKIYIHFGGAIRDQRVTAIAFACKRKWTESQ